MKTISNVEPCAMLEIPTTRFDSEADLADYLVAEEQSTGQAISTEDKPGSTGDDGH
jgi:hypothetical protein